MLIFNFNKSFSGNAPPLAFGEAERIIVAHTLDEIQPALDTITAETKAGKYAAGFLSYEAAAAFDPALKTVAHANAHAKAHTAGETNRLPLMWFGLYAATNVSHAPPVAGLALYNIGEWQPDTAPDEYAASIKKIREYIRNGDIYQANFTLRLQSQFTGSAEAWYEDLRRDANGQGSHGRFNAFLDIGSHRILSMSPELFFSWDGSTLRTRPMKGTARRSAPPAVESAEFAEWQREDKALAEALLASTKNRAENLMIVDLLRNDVSRVAKPGTVAVPHLFTLETYPTVYQMTSTVIAETRDGTNVADIFKALFPCGSITGAPKIKSSEVIAECETSPRGIYCGALGYIAPDGTAVFNVPIRTIVIDAKSGAATCGVGGGIVWDSETRDEYAEAMAKAAFMKNASHGYELLETLRLQNNEYAWLDRHLTRLIDSANELGFDADEEKIRAALREHASAHPNETRRVRLLVSQTGLVTITSEIIDSVNAKWFKINLTNSNTGEEFGAQMLEDARPEPCLPILPYERIVKIAATPVDRHERALRHKTTRRAVYDMHRDIMALQYPDAFDVLLWNQQRELTEFTYGSLVLEINGEWLTPALSAGLLPGVLRAELIARGDITERVLSVDDLARATSVWFINSVRGWIKVSVEGQLN